MIRRIHLDPRPVRVEYIYDERGNAIGVKRVYYVDH